VISHHDGCFGCGQANLFGLQLELDDAGDGSLRGRFFVKQDHQGPPGYAHGGVLATALDEAMSLVAHHAGVPALTKRLEVDLRAPAPVGAFVEVSARVDSRDERRLRASAEARDGERLIAAATGEFSVRESVG
jgi:acyl-coenzyme A thioesterase PaaI-like protein